MQAQTIFSLNWTVLPVACKVQPWRDDAGKGPLEKNDTLCGNSGKNLIFCFAGCFLGKMRGGEITEDHIFVGLGFF